MKPVKLTPLALIAPLALISCQKEQAKKPNIIFFLVDDMGWTETSLQFGDSLYDRNRMFHTPNMERMARMGVMMTDAYACPVSSPTRAAMMTGMNAAHMRITSYCSLWRDMCPDAIGGRPGSENENLDDPFAHSDWNFNGIAPAQFDTPEMREQYRLNRTVFATPFPQILKDNGYFTIHVGKGHWSPHGLPGANPQNFGFVVGLCAGGNGHPESHLSEDNFGNIPGRWTYASVPNMSQYYDSGIHLTEALTQEALKTLEYPIDQEIPFYLYLSHHAVHTPIQPDERFYAKYIEAGMDEGQARFSSMVEGMDKSLGDVLDFVESKGIADNTIIVFMTDNGGDCVSPAKGGERHSQNSPLRSGKGSCYEGGIRVPMMVYWPGHTQAGSRISTPVMPEDIFPSILELAGIESYSTVQPIDGQSWTKLVCGCENANADAQRDIIFHYPHQYRVEDQPDIDFISSIRRGNWKLVYRMHDAKLELYNLKDDIGESQDLAMTETAIVSELAKALADSLRSWNASMPRVRATGQPVPWPDEL